MKISETNIIETFSMISNGLFQRNIRELEAQKNLDLSPSTVMKTAGCIQILPNIFNYISLNNVQVDFPIASIITNWVSNLNFYFKSVLRKPINFTVTWNSFQEDVNTSDRIDGICQAIDVAIRKVTIDQPRTVRPEANGVMYIMLNGIAVDTLVRELVIYEDIPEDDRVKDIVDFLAISKKYYYIEKASRELGTKSYRYFNVHSATIWLKKEFGYIFTETMVKKILFSVADKLSTVPLALTKSVLFEFLEQQLELNNIKQKRILK